ncbi:MAG TPA: ATP-binding protein [Bryobacteraceae bacterium]|nr:ATP-binding protein [Bryobacteraceae bacterium]
MSAAEQQARVLRYWRAIELFSPQKVPRLNPNSQTEPVLRSGGDTPLPWFTSGGLTSGWFPTATHGSKWRFTAYCGLYRLGRLRARLEHHFARKHSVNFDQRPDGESCLAAFQITADGRPLLDTFVLASAPWAEGCLEKSGAQAQASLQGFEAAASEQSLRLAERFAVRENDQVGRLLLQQGFHVGRPIQPGDLEIDIEQIAQSLGVAASLRPQGFRLAGHQIPEKYALEADSDDFLNSFFLRDLERVADAVTHSRPSAALSRFLLPDSALAADHRQDVRNTPDLLWQKSAPQLVPPARWPASPHQSLYFSQQFAINSALESFDTASNPLFAINGPPGTGKTTLLRDVIAAVLVRRAQALARLARPALAFEDKPAQWNTADHRRPVHLWRPAFLGFEIVVASSNNRAVENVTLEIPAKHAVDPDCLPAIDYFADFATRLLAAKKDAAGEPIEAWGLIAARLGNRKNRRDFMKRFWGADKQLPEPRDRAHEGFYRYLKSLRPGPASLLAWKKAVSEFQQALKAEAVIRQERTAGWQAVSVETDLRNARIQLTNLHADLEAVLAARRNHHSFKPGLVDALFTRGGAYQEWRDADGRLAATVAACQTACDAARARLAGLSAAQEHLTPLTASFPAPSLEQWLANPEARELSSPWADESWNRARNRVFLAALYLHRVFIECAPQQIRQNLDAAMDVLGGKVSSSGPSLQSAWATLFFVVPVVSTTFASFDRLFSNLGSESLGWLLIDEAGQAVPQAAAGALWRTRRAMVVGDPRQLEPIVPLPHSAQRALQQHFEVDETWLPSNNSAQKLADRVSPLGTWIENADEEEPIWVGAPLRVHRRCQRPMFDISNLIAYDGQMVFATEEVASSFLSNPLTTVSVSSTPPEEQACSFTERRRAAPSCALPPSSWIDIAGSESDGHWIPAEGVVLEILLSELQRASIEPSSILLISPFRAVARKLSAIAARHGIRLRGTVHVSQGKEAAVVILVLGGDPRRVRAKGWASEKPNLLNVAVSRAQHRLYIIGNREEWSQYPNFAEAAALLGKEKLHPIKSLSARH